MMTKAECVAGSWQPHGEPVGGVILEPLVTEHTQTLKSGQKNQ